jgi:hypothetical protein
MHRQGDIDMEIRLCDIDDGTLNAPDQRGAHFVLRREVELGGAVPGLLAQGGVAFHLAGVLPVVEGLGVVVFEGGSEGRGLKSMKMK